MLYPPQNTSQNSQNEETSQNTSPNTQNSNQTQTAQTSSSNTSQQKTTEQANAHPSQQNQQTKASSSASSKTDTKKTANTDKNSKDKKINNTANAQNQTTTPLVVEIATQLPVQAEISKETAHNESSAATLAHSAKALLAETKQEQKTKSDLKPLSAETKQTLLSKEKTNLQGSNASVSNIHVSHTPQHTSAQPCFIGHVVWK